VRFHFCSGVVLLTLIAGAARAGIPASTAAPAPLTPTIAPAPATTPTPAAPPIPATTPPAPTTAPASAPSAVAPAPASATPAPATPQTEPGRVPEAAPPPGYYVEQPVQESGEAYPPNGAPTIYEPPPPEFVIEPPPPTTPHFLAPRTAFWFGARVSWFAPFGSAWTDGFYDGTGLYYRRRALGDYASSGPALELDVGARLSRHYNVFAIWEHAFLGTGSLDQHSFGGQKWGNSNFWGAGLRFSTNPNHAGFLMEVAVGYRDFHAYWSDGTELALTGSLDARIGVGADIRVTRFFSLSPMITLGGGSFNSGHWSGPVQSGTAFTSQYDGSADYGTVSLQIGGHFDVR
jgi:hypothetical protein